MADGLKFEDSVQLAIKTIRQTPHSRLNMTPFQMHLGKKPRTALTNIIGKPECLLSNWKKTLTNCISAQPTELQVVTINDAEGEMADYLVLNDTRTRNRSVGREFKKYQFLEKENKPNSMKCGFKTNETLTAITETDYTVTISDGGTIYKKLASKPLKFQPQGNQTNRRRSSPGAKGAENSAAANSAKHTDASTATTTTLRKDPAPAALSRQCPQRRNTSG